MGNDGGSIPKRRELVKEAAKNPTAAELKETQQEQQVHLWTVDPLTNRPLSRPVVSDCLGRLFSKASIIEYLLPGTDEDAGHRGEQDEFLKGTVKSLKDIVEVKFEVEPATSVDSSAGNGNTRTERWICPITTKELGPATKTVYLVPCGHAFSEIAVKEVSGSQCLQCNESYAPNDIITILPTSEVEIARLVLRAKMLAEKRLAHSLRKISDPSKKRKKEVAALSIPPSMLNDQASANLHKSKTSILLHATGGGIKNAATATLAAKVLEEQEDFNKRRKLDKNHNINSLFSERSTSVATGKGKNTDFMSRGFAIPALQQK